MQVEMHLLSMVKFKVLIRNLIILRDLFYWTQVTRKKSGVLPVIMPYGSPAKFRIYCMVVFLNFSVMEKYFHTKTSKYGVCEYTSSMDMLQEIIFMIDHIKVISWDIQLLQELISTEIQIKNLLSTDPIMFGLMNIIIIST